MMTPYSDITEDEVAHWCDDVFGDYTLARFTLVLNGGYDLKDARDDILSLRGTKYGLNPPITNEYDEVSQ